MSQQLAIGSVVRASYTRMFISAGGFPSIGVLVPGYDLIVRVTSGALAVLVSSSTDMRGIAVSGSTSFFIFLLQDGSLLRLDEQTACHYFLDCDA